MSNNLPIQIELTTRFKKDLTKLAKRYRSIRHDLKPLLDQLQSGEIVGDLISGIKYQVYKVRLKNSNIKKGKSSGYRVIYYLKTKTNLILITLYSKSDQSDIQNNIIKAMIQEFEQEN